MKWIFKCFIIGFIKMGMIKLLYYVWYLVIKISKIYNFKSLQNFWDIVINYGINDNTKEIENMVKCCIYSP